MAGGAAAAAAVAAAAERQRIQLEEEQMTAYGSGDLNQDWEFKIVRANRAVFGKPAHFNRVLAEEARAGWVLVEKFDDMRLRFKRSRQARLNDSMLPPGVDPYRVHYGLRPGPFVLLLVMTILALCAGVIALVMFLVI
ncbi:MAG TPA: hypothetical protein VFV49_02175 [Thermoanaerobaculia bacterium]|nr:hypothetical protein [Thermoanaerobaculia bacterium]